MKIFDKINFKEPKYMLPAILYVPLLVASYFIFDLFHAETAEIPDKTMQMTEYLNPDLPDARIKGDIGSKYENMAKSWGKIQDYSAVDNIEREESDDNKEEYESQWTTSPCWTNNSRKRLRQRKLPMPRRASRKPSRNWRKPLPKQG